MSSPFFTQARASSHHRWMEETGITSEKGLVAFVVISKLILLSTGSSLSPLYTLNRLYQILIHHSFLLHPDVGTCALVTGVHRS